MTLLHNKTHTQFGFTQFELVVVVILISILGSIALNRMWAWRSEVERTLIKTVSGNLRSVLGLETAQLALQNKLHELPKLAGSNPFDLLAQKPDQYLGSLPDGHPDTKKTGVWYYSPKQKALIYTIRFTDDFKTNLTGQPRVRLKIQFIYTDTNHNRQYDAGIDGIAGLNLISPDKYLWVDTNG